jgi:hypothetical protein
MSKSPKVWAAAAIALAGLGSANCAQANFIATLPGNDCPGYFNPPGTNGFGTCVVPANNSPVIIKINFNGTNFGQIDVNTALFPTITGEEFTFTFDPVQGTGVGTWTYTPGTGDPLNPITHYAAKGGNNFNLFSNPGNINTNNFYTPTNSNNGKPFGLSHITFYDSNGDIPPPPPSEIIPEIDAMAGTGALVLLAGVLTLAGERRRKS